MRPAAHRGDPGSERTGRAPRRLRLNRRRLIAFALGTTCLASPAYVVAQDTVLLVGGDDALAGALRLELTPRGLDLARIPSGGEAPTLPQARAHATRHGAQAVVWVTPVVDRVHVAWVGGGASEALLPGVTTPRSIALVASGLLDDARSMPTLPGRALARPPPAPMRPVIVSRSAAAPPREPSMRPYVQLAGGAALDDRTRLPFARVSAGGWFEPGATVGAVALAFLGERHSGGGNWLCGGAFGGLELGWAWQWDRLLLAAYVAGQLGLAEGFGWRGGFAQALTGRVTVGAKLTAEWGIMASGEFIAARLPEAPAIVLGVASIGMEWAP